MPKKQLTGTVTSDKMERTVVVEVETKKPHPRYHKVVRKWKKFTADDRLGAKVGDTVKIEETKPMSKTKKWKVVKIIKT